MTGLELRLRNGSPAPSTNPLMMEQTLEQQFAELTATAQVEKLIKHLTEANRKLPAFVFPNTCDAITTLGSLCRTHSNTDDDHTDQFMGLISAVLLNALIDYTITILNEE